MTTSATDLLRTLARPVFDASPAPADFASVFAVLAGGGFLSADAVSSLQSMASP